MEKYVTPETDIITFDTEDVITTSGDGDINQGGGWD